MRSIMQQIRIKNIRSLEDTGNIPLAPITLLVGENSSGKSTFLRTFPLLKQSITKKTDGPILWAGDVDDYVDFGSFKETITDGSNGRMEICFTFQTFLLERISLRWFDDSLFDGREANQIYYSIIIDEYLDKEDVSEVKIIIDSSEFDIQLPRNREDDFTLLVDGEKFLISPESKTRLKSQNKDYYFWYFSRIDNRSIFGYTLPDLLTYANDQLRKIAKLQVRNTTDDSVSLVLIGEALVKGAPLAEVGAYFSKISIHQDRSANIIKRINTIVNKAKQIFEADQKRFACACKILFFITCFSQIDGYVNEYFHRVHYIAPLRATAERYYRLRNSAIDEVDYQGKNLAIFLNSLDNKRMKRFQSWTQKSFGFSATVQKNVGHLSVAIFREGFNKEINLSDTGFGYSQILPIITQLWELSTRNRVNQHSSLDVIPLVVAIEQPELHLHPAMQGRLAKAFIACIKLAKDNGYQLQLLLETHSQTMVDYFGRAVARNELSTSDIAVVLFERDGSTGHTNVRKTEYDSFGMLKDWPIGFFEPEE